MHCPNSCPNNCANRYERKDSLHKINVILLNIQQVCSEQVFRRCLKIQQALLLKHTGPLSV